MCPRCRASPPLQVAAMVEQHFEELFSSLFPYVVTDQAEVSIA